MSAEHWIRTLHLHQHVEGGWYSETYRSTDEMATQRQGSSRNVMTSIYYMLTRERPTDYLHRNRSDIVHYFHAGSPITYLVVTPEGELHRHRLGLDGARGETPQLIVPAGHWKTARLEEGEYGLIGEAVAPGFDYRDMTLATPAAFQEEHPHLFGRLLPYIKAAA
jgi:predicted cupin superfamily sugar epimerase